MDDKGTTVRKDLTEDQLFDVRLLDRRLVRQDVAQEALSKRLDGLKDLQEQSERIEIDQPGAPAIVVENDENEAEAEESSD